MRFTTAFSILASLSLPVFAQDAPEATPAPDAAKPEAQAADSGNATATPAPDVEPTPAPTPEESPAPATGEAASAPTPAAEKSSSASEDTIPLPSGDNSPADAPIVSEGEVPALDRPASSGDAAFTGPGPQDAIPSNPDLPPAPSGPSAEEISRKMKLRYQELRTKVEKDPALRSLKEQADNAKTFEDERAALREYYRLLFSKIKKADSQLADRCDALERAYLARLAQMRLEPTIPLNPPPTPAPLAN